MDDELEFKEEIFEFIRTHEGPTLEDIIHGLNHCNQYIKKKLKDIIRELIAEDYIKAKGRPPKRYWLTENGKELYYQSVF